MATSAPAEPPDVEGLVHEARDLDAGPMPPRERIAEGLVGGAALLAAGVLLVLGDPGRTDLVAALVLSVAYGLAGRARFEVGFGVTDLSLLVVVPMLFVLPPEVVPVLVALVEALGRAPEVVRGTVHPERLLKAPANAWFAIALAAVLMLGVDGGPRWEDAGWYVVAFGAMVVVDAAAGLAREALTARVAPDVQLRVFVPIYALDAGLFPVGLLAAFATAQADYAFLLLAPLAGVLAGAASEREKRITQAVELVESRAEVLGAISHSLQTPLSVVVGLADALDRRAAAAGEHDLTARLRAEAHWLRHQVDQTLDFQRLHAGWPLRLRSESVDVAARAYAVAVMRGGPPEVVVEVAEDVGPAQADARRVTQILHGLLDNARKAGPPDRPIVLRVGRRDGAVVASVTDEGAGVPAGARERLFAEPTGARGTDESQGTGITLYVSRALAEAMGGTLEADLDGPGTTFVLVLPAAPAPRPPAPSPTPGRASTP